MINLFFVTHDFSGVRTYTNELLKYFNKCHNIVVHRIFIGSCDVQFLKIIQIDNIVNIYIPQIQREWKIDTMKYAERCLDLLDPVIRNKKQIIFHLNHPLHKNMGVKAKIRYNAKLVFTYHFLPNSFSCIELSNFAKTELSKKGNPLDKEIINEVDIVFCVTRFAKRMVTMAYNKPTDKVIAIHNGLGNELKVNSVLPLERQKIKQEMGFRKDEKIILFVGRFEKRKGLTYLFRAFNRLCEKYPTVRLVLAGDGEIEDTFRSIPGHWGRITFTGSIPLEVLTKLYSITHIGVIPSIYEQCSYVALEMMQHGLPIVVSGVPGLKELFTDKKNALVVPIHKSSDRQMETELRVPELVKKLETLLENEKLRQKLGENARKQWEQFYTVKQMGEATLKQYCKLIGYPQNEMYVE